MLVRSSCSTAIYWSSIQFARRLAKRALSGSTSREEEKGEGVVVLTNGDQGKRLARLDFPGGEGRGCGRKGRPKQSLG